MKLVVISDLHLDQSTAGVDRFDDIKTVLDTAVEYATSSGDVDAFVFLGDLTDPNTVRAHRSVDALAGAFAGLEELGVRCIAVAGNHDVIEDGSGRTVLDSLRWLGAAIFTEPSFFEFEPNGRFVCTFVALPFTATCNNYDPDAFIRSLPELREPVVVLGHLNLKGITLGSESTDMPRGRDVFWPLEALKARLPDALLLGGHYHTPQMHEGVRIVGSAVRLRFDEKDNAPGFVVVEWS